MAPKAVNNRKALLIAPIAVGLLFSAAFFLRLQTAQAAGESAFDKVIDPEKYTVGPGDRFQIDFWDGATPTILATITPEGFLLLPSIGQVNVADLNLEKARKRIQEVVVGFYPDSQFSITLAGTRTTKILISGGVVTPGLYEMLASQRVSEVITKAGGFIDGSSMRNIAFTGGTSDYKVDLMRYNRLGELDANPYLYCGLKVNVPMVLDSSSFVQVSGEVINPGGFEYSDGDDFGTMIKLALGFTGNQGDSALIFRDKQRINIGIGDLTFPIRPGDKIIVNKKASAEAAGYFSVTGEAALPGRFPYEKGLNLEKAIQYAGGLTEKGDIFSLTIFRRVQYQRESETAKSLKAASVNNMTFSKVAEPVSLRVDEYYPDKLNEIPIYPGDSIYIPYLTGSIGVYGMVNQPGMVTATSPKMKLSEVIKKAGGYARGANKKVVDVFRKSSGLKITAGRNISVYDGDIVIVPKPAPQEKTMWDKLKDIATMIGAAGVVYLVAEDLSD